MSLRLNLDSPVLQGLELYSIEKALKYEYFQLSGLELV